MVTKLFALNQFDQPPGVELYNSDNRWELEYNNSRSPVDEAREFLRSHPDFNKPHVESTTYKTPDSISGRPKEQSVFKHKDSEFLNNRNRNNMENPKYEPDYDQVGWKPKISPYPQNEDIDSDYTYQEEPDVMSLYGGRKQLLETLPQTNRDPRSKKHDLSEMDDSIETTESTSKKKNLADQNNYGIYDYKNIRSARNRLMHDLNNVPTDILKDTYFKNRERRLRKSRFEQRDLKSHKERMRENDDVRKTVEEEKRNLLNNSLTLWDLESESEMEDRENGYYRGKRHVYEKYEGIPRLTSVGTLAKSINSSTNSIDLIFLTYWLPPVEGAQLVLEKDVQCISEKIKNAMNSKEKSLTFQKSTLEELFKKECIEERIKQNTNPGDPTTDDRAKNFPYYNQVAHLNLGQMTVYRVRIQCVCQATKKNERCSRFLDSENQGWPSYLGRKGDGYYKGHI